MGLPKGKTNNPGGRPKGSQNKVTAPLREMITGFLEMNFHQVIEDFGALDSKDKLKFYTDLLPFALPKLQATSTTIDYDSLSEEQLDQLIDRIASNHERK